MKKIFRANSGFITRKIAGESILVPVGPMAMKIHGMIALSESGQLLWDKLQSDCTEEELVTAILQEYDTDYETAKEDVSSFLNQMSYMGMLHQSENEVGI